MDNDFTLRNLIRMGEEMGYNSFPLVTTPFMSAIVVRQKDGDYQIYFGKRGKVGTTYPALDHSISEIMEGVYGLVWNSDPPFNA